MAPSQNDMHLSTFRGEYPRPQVVVNLGLIDDHKHFLGGMDLFSLVNLGRLISMSIENDAIILFFGGCWGYIHLLERFVKIINSPNY